MLQVGYSRGHRSRLTHLIRGTFVRDVWLLARTLDEFYWSQGLRHFSSKVIFRSWSDESFGANIHSSAPSRADTPTPSPEVSATRRESTS